MAQPITIRYELSDPRTRKALFRPDYDGFEVLSDDSKEGCVVLRQIPTPIILYRAGKPQVTITGTEDSINAARLALQKVTGVSLREVDRQG